MKLSHFVVKAAMSNNWMRALCLLFIVVFLIPVFLTPLFLYDDTAVRNEIEQSYSILTTNMASGVFDDFSEQSKREFKEEERALQEMIALDPGQEFYEQYAAYEKIDIERISRGDRTGDVAHAEALYRLASLLSQTSSSEDAPRAGHLPVLYQLPYTYAALPVLVWLVPSFAAAAFSVHCFKRHSLFDAAPVSTLTNVVSQLTASLVIAFGMLAIAYAPSFLVGLIFNGMGSFDYPIVFCMGSTLVETTALRAYVLTLAYILLSNALMLVLFAFGLALVGDRFIALLLPIVCACMSMAEGVMSTGSFFSSVATFIPITYLSASRLIGFVRCFPTYGQGVTMSLSAEQGLIVISVWCLTLLTVMMALIGLRAHTAKRHDDASSASEATGLALRHAMIGNGCSVLFEVESLCIRPCETCGLVAPNGSGKTTLMKALAGDRSCLKRGRVSAGFVAAGDRRGFNKKVLYVPCDGTMLQPDMTALDHLVMVKELWDSPLELENAMTMFGLDEFARVKVGKLSLGMKQQLTCAMAYLSNARFLLLDEPTNALDPDNARRVRSAIEKMRSGGRGILVSSHALGFIDSVCDRLLTIFGGRLEEGEVGKNGGSAQFYFSHGKK